MSKMLNATDNRAKTGPNCFLPTNSWLTVSHCMIWGKKKKKASEYFTNIVPCT